MASIRQRKNCRDWYYRYIDENGKQRERKGCPDRRETERLAAAAESQVTRIKAGLVDPKDVAYSQHEARPLQDHLADWQAYLLDTGKTQQHANLSYNRARRLIELVRLRRISGISPSRIQSALKMVR